MTEAVKLDKDTIAKIEMSLTDTGSADIRNTKDGIKVYRVKRTEIKSKFTQLREPIKQ